MYKYILFDLDGTLTDPGIGITNSVMYALKKFNIEVEDRASLYKFIGPPLLESFEKYYDMSKEESEQALKYYREYFRPHGLYENEVYDGVEDLLKALKEQGKALIVATSKPEEFAVEILKHFKLDKYFDFIAGATMDEKRVKKADVIAYALEECGVSDLTPAIMIGDREHDVLGAKQVGLASIGVLYGYGDREELELAGATYIAENADDILKTILNNE
ncbi:MAG: HAD family hydrolase [Roseburia sp.]|nr:HAD family hydrolase [Roseburia sp.]